MSEIKKTDDSRVAQIRDDAIRRALNTPPKPTKAYIGTTERAQTQKKGRVKKSVQSGPDKNGPLRGGA